MSNFSKEELYEIYGNFLPSFTDLAREANARNIELFLTVDTEGGIRFESRDYFEDKGSKYVRTHHIKQDIDSVGDGTDTYRLS